MPLPKNTEPLDVVLTDDEYLHPEMDKSEYRKTRDPALIRDMEGLLKAHRFTLHPLPRKYALALKTQVPSEDQRHYLAAMASLRAVIYPNGERKDATGLQTLSGAPKGETWQAAGQEWENYLLEILSFDQIIVLGRIAFDRASVPANGILPLR